MTFILLLTYRFFGHSVDEADLSLAMSDVPRPRILGLPLRHHLLRSLSET